MKPYHLGIISFFVWFSCTSDFNDQKSSKTPLATVYNKSLYLDDLEGMLPSEDKPADSLLMLNSIVERWVREALLMHEAEKKISQNLDLDKLVRDYRSTLVLHNYEKLLIETKMDTLISNVELQRFYEQNQGFYQLKEPVIRALFMKIPKESIGLAKVDGWWQNWNKENALKLIEYNDKNGEVYMLNEDNWYEIEKISRHLPDSLNNFNISSENTNIIRQDALYKYYLRVLEKVEDNQPPPLNYIEEKAKKLILQKRKNNLIEKEKNDLYQKNKNNSNVKIYSK